MNMIEFDHVWKKFNRGEKIYSLRDAIPYFFKQRFLGNNGLKGEEFWALRDVNFKVKKGDVVGIIGPNGAGKSTILKLLSRILSPNKGTMKINGRLSALIEVTAGFHPELTGRENVYLNGTILGMRKKEINEKFDEIVDFSGVWRFIDTPVKRYSSGMYARLGFSVAAHMNPDIMLVDEVLAVGDMSFQSKCAQKMRSLLNSGTTIVLVTHNLTLVQSMCKRVILLNKGEMIKDDNPDKVIPYYQNLVYQKEEEDIKNKPDTAGYKIRVTEKPALTISKVQILGQNNVQKDDFGIEEPISMRIFLEMNELIDSPIISVEIARSDGVVCCEVNSKGTGLNLSPIRGKREIDISFGRLYLAPGIYMVRITIWDKEMMHPYASRRNDILRIETASGFSLNSNSVFLPSAKWKFK